MTLGVKEMFSYRELLTKTFYRDVVAEFMVSMFLNIMVGFSLFTLDKDLYQLDMITAGFVSGFGIYLLIEAYGPISGGHMNPSTTFAHCLAGRVTVVRAIFYMGSQSAGGIFGSEIVYLLSPDYIRATFKPFQPHPDITPWQGMLIEMIFTFNLIYTGLSASDVRVHNVYVPGLATGFCVGVGIWCVGTWTGACQNPMVALGPAVVTNNYRHLWIYWVGAYLAGLLAAICHRVFYLTRDKVKDVVVPGGTGQQSARTGHGSRDPSQEGGDDSGVSTIGNMTPTEDNVPRMRNGSIARDDTKL